VRSLFTKHGGNLAGSGAVMFQFLHCGQILVARDTIAEERLMEIGLEAGADDILSSDEGYELRCDIHVFDRVLHALEKAGLRTESAEIAYVPTSTVPVSAAQAEQISTLHEALENLEDVQHVFSNEQTA
jgi:transcriptional/translational regulatory protein YebC/TACO1